MENDEDQDEDEELDLTACMRAKRRQSTSDCCLITSMVPSIYTGHGIFYFEMVLKEDRRSSGNPTAGIGFTSDVSSGYNDFPGWGFNSIGYHGDDGTVVFHHEQLKNNLRTYGVGDIVGAGIGMFVSQKAWVFFTQNGVVEQAMPIELEEDSPMYPCIGLM